MADRRRSGLLRHCRVRDTSLRRSLDQRSWCQTGCHYRCDYFCRCQFALHSLFQRLVACSGQNAPGYWACDGTGCNRHHGREPRPSPQTGCGHVLHVQYDCGFQPLRSGCRILDYYAIWICPRVSVLGGCGGIVRSHGVDDVQFATYCGC